MNLGQVLHDAAAAAGVGAAAGLFGTAAMTLSSTVEAQLSGRGSSTTSATAVANTLGVEPKSDNHEQRLNNIAHWGYGTSGHAARPARRGRSVWSRRGGCSPRLGVRDGTDSAVGDGSVAAGVDVGREGACRRPVAPRRLRRCDQRGVRVAGPPVSAPASRVLAGSPAPGNAGHGE